MASINELMRIQIQKEASDLILKVGTPATMRINGDLVTLDTTPLTDADIESGISETLNEVQLEEFHNRSSTDHEIPDAFARAHKWAEQEKKCLS